MKYLAAAILLLFSSGANAFAAVGRELPMESRQAEVHVSDAETVTATIKVPKDLRPGEKVPVFLIFGGFESAGQVLDLIHPDRRVALASFDYPFSAPRRFQIKEALAAVPQIKALYPKTVRGISELVRILANDPRIDAHEIVAIGASFGSPFVLAAANQTPEISKLAIVHGFGQVPQTAENVILRSWLPKYGWPSRPAAWLISRLLWLYLGTDAPEASARKLTGQQDVLMIIADHDSFIPRSASESLWRALQESGARTKQIVMPGDHLMPGADRQIDQIEHQVEAWLGLS